MKNHTSHSLGNLLGIYRPFPYEYVILNSFFLCRDKTGLVNGSMIISFKSIFQDVRSAVDYVHLDASCIFVFISICSFASAKGGKHFYVTTLMFCSMLRKVCNNFESRKFSHLTCCLLFSIWYLKCLSLIHRLSFS